MKNFKRVLCILSLIIMLFALSPTIKSYASWWDNPVTFYQEIGENVAYYDLTGSRGSFFFGQRGITRSIGASEWYGIIGFNFTVTNNGSSYTGGFRVEDFNCGVSDVKHSDGYTYSLWRFNIDDLVSILKSKYTSTDFSFIYSRNYDTRFIFNSLVTTFTPSGANAHLNYDGSRDWGVLYSNSSGGTGWYDEWVAWPSWISQAERDALYNIPGTIKAIEKPNYITPTSFAMIPKLGRPGWNLPTTHYIDGYGNNWVNLKDEFTIYAESTLPSSTVLGNIGYPDYSYVTLEGNGTRNAIYKTSSSAGNNTYGAESGFLNNFLVTDAALSKKNENGSNYIFSRFHLKAKVDGQTYRLSHTAVKGNNYNPSVFTGEVLKTDGTAPIISGGSSTSNWTNNNVIISASASDTGSGMSNMSIYDNSWGWKTGSTSSANLTVSSEGEQTYILRAIDNVGNETSKTTQVKIDKTKPSVTFSPNSKSWTKDNIAVNISPSDNLSGVKQWRYAISTNNGTSYGNWSNYINGDTTGNITLSSEYLNKIKVEVMDNAGNVNSVISGTYQIDKTAPTAASYDVVDRQEETFTIEIVGVTDNNGSGVKSQQVKVWVDTPIGKKEKLYTPMAVDNNKGKVVVNRNDFAGVTRTYYYELTLVDNVGNSRTYAAKTGTMIQNNLTANRIDIYDPREQRYVSQVISGLPYEAVLEVKNTGERAITKAFDIGLKIDGAESKVITETSGIEKDEVKNYRFDFIAGEENLNGVVYEGIADYRNIIHETNENDNNKSSENPYSTPRSDENPPIIPPIPPTGEKIPDPVPIITVKLDLVAEYIDIVELNSDVVVTEVITDDIYRFKYKIRNNSSLALRYIDVIQKTFESRIFYSETSIGSVTINDMNKGEVKTFYKEYKVPLLPDGIVEDIKTITLYVDINNNLLESDEENNSLSKNKKIIGLKVTDYRITDSVSPITTLNYPIYTSEMPLKVKAGYNVTFKVNILGKPDRVYSKIKDSRGKDYGIVEMIKEKDIDSVRSEWIYIFAPHVDTIDDTLIITEIFADRNSFSYNYNTKEGWNGNTLKIGGNAKEDIIIYRKY